MFSGATRDKTGSFWAVILLAQLAPQFWSNTCAFNGRQKWINHPLLKAAKLATCSIVAVEQRQRTSCQSLRSRRALNGFDSLLVVRSLFAATWKWRTVKIARGENDRYEIAGHENAGLIMLDKKHGSSWHETIAFLLWSYPTWTPAGMGKGGALAALWKCCEVFLCIGSDSKTLSRRIIYALFSQPVVGFWGLRLQTSSGYPFLDPAGGLSSQTPNLPTPKKILRAHMLPDSQRCNLM